MITLTVIFWMSVVAFILFMSDKCRARLGWRRVPEAVLLGVSFLGGAFGGLMGMLLFRHKTRKPLFCILLPLFAVLQVVGAFFLLLHVDRGTVIVL